MSCEDTKRLVYCGAAATFEVFGATWAKGASTWGGWLSHAATKTASRLQISKAERIEDLSIKGLLRTFIRQALPATGEHG